MSHILPRVTHSVLAALTAVLFVCGLTACGPSEPGQGSSGGTVSGTIVGVIDLDGVAKAMGYSDQITKTLSSTAQDYQIRLSGLQGNLQQAVDAEKAKIGEKPTPEQEQRLQAVGSAAMRQLQIAEAQVKQELARLQGSLIAQAREQLKPAARRVAQAKGVQVVLLPSDALFYSDQSVDLTNAMIDELQKNPVTIKFKAVEEMPASQPATQPAPK